MSNEKKEWRQGQLIAAAVGAAVLAMQAELTFPHSLGAAALGAVVGAVLYRWLKGAKP